MKTEKSKRLKGSVLFTVVSVMSLLIIFLMGTLLLASAASERAHRSYSTSQAEYTARTAIESFSQAMQDNAAIAQSVVNMSKNDSFEPTVQIGSADMGSVGYYDNTNTWVDDKILVECIDETYVYSNDSKKWEPQQVIKVSATAKVGREEQTVTAYLRKKAPDETKPPEIKGFQCVGDGGFTTTKGYLSGDLTLGLLDTGNEVYELNNDSVVDTGITFINGTLNVGAQIDFLASKTGCGTVIMGDLNQDSGNGTQIIVDYPYAEWNDSTSSIEKIELTQKDIPYFYVDGNLNVTNKFNVIANGINTAKQLRKDAPFNIFCGSFKHTGNNINIASDIYIMGNSGSSQFGTTAGTSKLNAWSNSIANKTNTQFYSEGGSIYSNEDLTLGNAVIRGDVHVNGNLKIEGNATIYGDLVVGNDVNGNPYKIYKNGSVVNSGNLSALDGVVKGKIYNGDSAQTGTGGLADNIYMKENTYVSGSYIKPGYVKVQNFEYGNIARENIKLENKVYSNYVDGGQVSEIQTIENIPYSQSGAEPAMEKIVTQQENPNGNNEHFTDADGKSYADVEIHDESGNIISDSNLQMITGVAEYNYKNTRLLYKIGDMYYTSEPYLDAETGGLTFKKSTSRLVFLDGTVTEVVPENVEIYKADKDGNRTNERTDKLSIIYQVDENGNATEIETDSYFVYYKAAPDLGADGKSQILTPAVAVTELYTYYKPDQNGNATSVETSEKSFYYRADANGFPYVDDDGNPEEVSETFSYYKLSDSDDPVNETEAVSDAGLGKYLAWYDENIELGADDYDSILNNQIYYYNADPSTVGSLGYDIIYKVPDSPEDPYLPFDPVTDDPNVATKTGKDIKTEWHNAHNVTKNNAYNSVAIYPLSAYGKEVYPQSMTKAALLGNSDGGKYKIVTTLDEVKDGLGYGSTGFDTNIYYDDVPGATITGGKYDGFDYVNISGNPPNGQTSHTYNISKNTVIKINKDNGSQAVNININPNGANIWVVLDNCSFWNSNHNIVVNGNGTVNFLIKGNVSLDGVGIYTKNIYDQYNAGGDIIVREEDKVNINYYGTQGSKLTLANNCLLCGIARCPYTDIEVADTAGKQGNWIYVNSNGISEKMDPNYVSWVGSALFKCKKGIDGNEGGNNFALLYTGSNDSQKDISNEVIQQSWKVMYYDVC